MTFDEYQKESRKTATYPKLDPPYLYPTLGLAGEAGEVVEKLKKRVRDCGGVVDDVARATIARELGDVLWYVAQLSTELGLSLATIAEENIAKLASRQQRDKLHGAGDNR